MQDYYGKDTARLNVSNSISTLAISYSFAVRPSLKTISKLKDKNNPHKNATMPIIENIVIKSPFRRLIDFSSLEDWYLE